MTYDVIVICSTIVSVTLICGVTTCLVVRQICDAINKVFPGHKLPWEAVETKRKLME